MIRVAVLLVLTLLMAEEVLAQGQTEAPTNAWVTMRPLGQGFRLVVPPDWEQGTPRGPNVKILVRSASGYVAGRVGVANCNVAVRAYPETKNRAQASLNAELRAGGPLNQTDALDTVGILQEGELLESRIVAVSGIPSYFIVVRGRYENLNVTTFNTMAMLLVFQPGRIHGATCAAATTYSSLVDASWVSWQSTILAILGTFALENY